ncbi:MAG TPA: LysM peptidoglycan-binding domain-containing protein [Ktedonobacterales bacterium]
MRTPTARAARELAVDLGLRGAEEIRSVVHRVGQGFDRARQVSPEQAIMALRSVWQARWQASRSGLATNLEYMRRKQPVPARLLLTLALPVVTTLILMQLVPAIQSSRADGCQWYTVQSGDTLSKLSARFGTTVAVLAATNHIANPDLIFVGQRLCVSTTASDNGSSNGSGNTQITNDPNIRASGEQAFVRVALPYAQEAAQQTGWPVSLVLAQWGVEQGWKTPGYTGFNWGNVAALPGEPTVGGIQKAGSPAAFAYAATPADGLRYYVHVAQLGYYTAVARAAQQSGTDAAARALGRSPWDAGHYTDHGDPGSSLLNMLSKYNLYQFDA